MGNRIKPAGLRLAVRVECGHIRLISRSGVPSRRPTSSNSSVVRSLPMSRTINSLIASGRLGARAPNIPRGLGSRNGFPSRVYPLHRWNAQIRIRIIKKIRPDPETGNRFQTDFNAARTFRAPPGRMACRQYRKKGNERFKSGRW